MKTRILLFMIAWLSLAPAVQAADGLTLSAVTLKPGEEADLTVSITQETNSYTGFQFDITLPDGLSLVADGSGKQYAFANSQTNSPVCDVEDLGHHAYRYVVYSDAMSAFKSGEVLSLRVKAVSGIAYGEYLLTLNNVILSDADGNTLKPAGRSYKVGIVADHLAENVSLESTVIKAGDTKDVSLTITQELEKYTGFQFDVTLPEGFSLESGTGGTVYTLSSSQTNNPVCDVESLGSNTYRFVVYSNSSTPFKNGEVLSLHVKAKSGMELKDYSLQLNQVMLSDADGNVTKTGSRVSTVRVTGFFTLTYQVDGNTYKSSTVEYGASITPEAAPTKEGYTFSGWSEIPQTMPAKDVTVTGAFTVNKYKLMYKVDGTEYKTTEVAYGTSITAEAAPAKEGFTFSGWSGIPSTMPAKDVTITGTFTVNRYTLTYQVDGQEYKTISYNYGAGISPEPAPTKTGYTFSGWSEIPSTMPAKDITVTGTFTVNKYKLVYKVDGEEYKSSEVEYGASITPETALTKEGHTFSGWSGIPSTMPANDVTITGTFTVNRYTIIYQVDGQTYKTVSYNYGADITAEAEPSKTGYTFSGWSEIPSTMPAEDITVTGTFTKGAFILTYVVDGETYKTVSYDYGSSITPESEPTKEGYTFSGWSGEPSTMPSEDVTVTGSFNVNYYKLTYLVDGEVFKTSDEEYGTRVSPEDEPTKEGYTFSGWDGLPSSMPAENVTVTGTFTINQYELTYQVDDETYKTVSYDYGASITAEAEPTKEGYTFSGWSSIPSSMPAEDVTVTGSFTVNQYDLTYMVDGETYDVVSYLYGESITPKDEPQKEGYKFSGWSWIPNKMPAENVFVTGNFTPIAITLDDLTYEVQNGVVIVVKVEVNVGNLKIEGSVTIDGKTYEVTTISKGAFQGCTGLTSVELPNSIETIAENAFEGCSGLRWIKIGKNIKEICSKAFANIFKLNSRTRGEEDEGLHVYCEAEKIPVTADDAFEGTPIGEATLHVANDLVETYRQTAPWSGFGRIVGLTDTAINGTTLKDTITIDEWYDLNGRRISQPKKGVNIHCDGSRKTKVVVIK